MQRPQPTEILSVNSVDFSHADIFQVVDTFYSRVPQNPELAVPFQSVHDWPEHIERLTHFWWTRFGGEAYMFAEYNPVGKHYYAGFNQHLLKIWLGLFHEVITEKLKPDQAQLWKVISERMGQGLSAKNEMMKQYMEREKK